MKACFAGSVVALQAGKAGQVRSGGVAGVPAVHAPQRLQALAGADVSEAGIRHVYEEFDDDHSDVDYRMDVSLPFLYRALK